MSWQAFADDEPGLANFVRERVHGKVAYLATIRKDGSPRVHPVTPVIDGQRMLVVMAPTSPKGRDLRRDPRFAIHCGVENARGGGGEVLIRGRAEVQNVESEAPATGARANVIFQLELDEVLITRTTDEGPVQRHWRLDGGTVQ